MWIAEDGTGGGGGGQISEDSSSESEEDGEDDDEDDDLIEGEGRSEVELMVTDKQTVSCDPRTISTYDAVDPPSSSHLRSAAIAPPPLPSSSTQIPCTPKSLSQTEELNELLRSPPVLSQKLNSRREYDGSV